MLRSGRLALSALAVGALALTGCGGAAAQGDSTADVLTSLRGDAKGSLQKTADTMGKATSVALTMEGTSGGTKTKARGVVALGGPLTAEITSEDEDGPTTVRMLGTAFYVQIPAEDRADLDGKSWMKMDFAGKDKTSADMARQFDDIDPAKQVRILLAGGAVNVVGEQTVGGVRTVHYTTTAPVTAYLGQVDTKIRAQVEKQLGDKGVKEVRTDLWVDEKYQLRRSRAVLGTDTDMTVDYTDHGKPVNVTAPPAAETVDFDELMKKLPGGTG